jgi:cytoskeletal protein RodZ
MKALGLAIREVRKSKRQTLMDLHYDTRIGYQTLGEIERIHPADYGFTGR